MPRPPSLASRPVLLSPPDLNTAFLAAPAATASPLVYPTVDPDELAENLFPEAKEDEDAAPLLPTTEETLVAVPDAQLHLIDPDRSIDLGAGTLSIVHLLQGGHSVASGHASSPRLRHLLSW
jgi:spartin